MTTVDRVWFIAALLGLALIAVGLLVMIGSNDDDQR